MSMEITNNYGNYITGYANAAKKTGSTESKNEAMRIVQERQAILIVWKNIMKNYVKSFRK